MLDTDVAEATLAFIEERRGQLLLHAGGAATSDGRTIVIHGASGAGKTTLTAALVTQGLAYVTDETLCLDPDTLAIEPFLKPLTVKPGSHELLAHLQPAADEVSGGSGNWQLPPERLGGPSLPEAALRPALIVFPDVVGGRDDVGVEEVTPARAAFVLGEQSSAMWAIEPRPLAALARLVLSAPAYQVSYGHAFDAARVIAGTLLPQTGAKRLEQIATTPEPTPAGTAGPRRAENVDWIVLEGEAVLFDGQHLHHLDGPGTAVWLSLDGEMTLTELAGDLAAHYGAESNEILLDVEDLVRVLAARALVTNP